MHNVNEIGFMSEERSRETVKIEKLWNLLIDYDFSYAGLTEIKKDWRKFSYADSIWGATDQWFENRRAQVSQNTNETPIDQRLYGGTSLIVFGKMVHRISGQGQDVRNLGRLSYLTIRGKNN